MDNEKSIELREEQNTTMLHTRLLQSNSTAPLMAARDALRTEFIIFGSILTVVFILLLLTLAVFTVYVRRRRPSLPTSPIPPSPPESLRATKATFTTMDDEDSIYEPIGNFSALSVSGLVKSTSPH